MIRFTLIFVGLGFSLVGGRASAAQLPLTQWESLATDEVGEANRSGDDLLEFMKREFTDKGKRVFRDAHPRGIGCVAATFTVDPNLPAIYRTGVFTEPGKKYDAIIRFSSSLGPVGDHTPDARGMAIKIFGVGGTKLLDDQPDAVTHDFLQIDGRTFPAKDTHDFAGIARIKLNPLSIFGFLRESPITHALELKAVFDLSSGNPDKGKSLSEMQFFSMVPYLLKGKSINTPVKFSSRPCSAVGHTPLDGGESELRNDLQQRLNKGDLCFEFLYQFYRDGAGYEVENGMSDWGGDPNLFTKFATIVIPKQTFLTDEKLNYCDNLSFQPWHAIAEHQPLGNIHRARKIIYEKISKSRHAANHDSSKYLEPTSIKDFKALTNPTYSVWDAVTVPESN